MRPMGGSLRNRRLLVRAQWGVLTYVNSIRWHVPQHVPATEIWPWSRVLAHPSSLHQTGDPGPRRTGPLNMFDGRWAMVPRSQVRRGWADKKLPKLPIFYCIRKKNLLRSNVTEKRLFCFLYPRAKERNSVHIMDRFRLKLQVPSVGDREVLFSGAFALA